MFLSYRGMLLVKENALIMDFFDHLGLALPPREEEAVKTFVYGILVNHRASIKNIAENTIQGQNERQMNRIIHQVSSKAREMLLHNLQALQKISTLAMRPSGVVSIDEHVIPKTGKHIEGVDYFYSTSENKEILGLSMINTHYYGGSFEYPIDCLLYRRLQELEKWGKQELHVPKNEIARQLIRSYHELGLPCKVWVMDSYFMTKENVKLLDTYDYSYVSKIKRNWVVTYQRQRWSVGDLYESIPETEFKQIEAVNSKAKKKRYFLMAHRDVFISKIGEQRIIYLRELEKEPSGAFHEKYKSSWMCLVSNMLETSPKGILQTYMKRWTIETSYRDESQELHLKGCMWRDIEGQYCFITLVFLAYRLLMWASRLGLLSPYSPQVDTIGKKREAFRRFHEQVFGEWITSLKQECKKCAMAKVLYALIYRGTPHAIEHW